MAAKKPPPLPGKPDFKEKLLKCSTCDEAYDKGKHQAKCLPCLHSHCKSCLIRYAAGKPQLNCPSCNKEVNLPGGTIDSLPDNFLTHNMKEHQKIFNYAVSCGNCDEGSSATSFCHDCGSFQCQNCVDNHRKMRSLHHHKMSTMTELREKKMNPLVQNDCEKHPTQSLTMYCRERDCRQPACASCGHTSHRGHDLIDLTAAADEIKADLRILTLRINKKNQKSTRMRAILEKGEKTLLESFNQKQKDMYESVQQVYTLIDSRYNDAQANLKHLFQTENDRLSANFKTIDSLIAQMTSACEFADNACDMSHPSQLLTSQIQILERLRELENAVLPETAAHTSELDFTSNHYSVLTQFQESLQHLYDINGQQAQPVTPISNGKSPMIRKKPAPGPAPPSPLLPQRRPRADPSKCTIQLRQPSERRWYLQAIVQTVDFGGKSIKTGGAEVKAKVEEGEKLQVKDNDNGTYTFDYLDNKFGNIIHVNIDGTPMAGSPFKA